MAIFIERLTSIGIAILMVLLVAFGIYLFFAKDSFSLESWKQKLSTHSRMIPVIVWGELCLLDKGDEKYPEKLSKAIENIIKKSTVLTVKAVNDKLIEIEKWYHEQMIVFSKSQLRRYSLSKKHSFQNAYSEWADTCISDMLLENSTDWLSKSETVQPLLLSLPSDFEEYRKSLEDYLSREGDLLELIKNGSNALFGVMISTIGFTSGNYIQGLQGVSLGTSSIYSQYSSKNIRERQFIQAKRKLEETVYALQISVEQAVVERWESQSQVLANNLDYFDTRFQEEFHARVLEKTREIIREKVATLQITSAEKESLTEKLLAGGEDLSPDERKLLVGISTR
ncbi:MAG: hypothetical protein OHK0047_02740 [Leptolyngbyaceae cyanobacterium]